MILSERADTLQSVVVDISEDDQHSEAFTLPGRPVASVLIPVTNGTPEITFEVSHDDGVTWVPLKDKTGSEAAPTINGGASAFWVSADDLSPIAPFLGPEVQVRFVFSVAQTSDRTLYVLGMC